MKEKHWLVFSPLGGNLCYQRQSTQRGISLVRDTAQCFVILSKFFFLWDILPMFLLPSCLGVKETAQSVLLVLSQGHCPMFCSQIKGFFFFICYILPMFLLPCRIFLVVKDRAKSFLLVLFSDENFSFISQGHRQKDKKKQRDE